MALFHVLIKLTSILNPQLAITALNIVYLMLLRNVEIKVFLRREGSIAIITFVSRRFVSAMSAFYVGL